MTSLTLCQVRASVGGSCARYFQKLLTSSTCRVRLISSKTARTCGEASRYSMAVRNGMILSSPAMRQRRTDSGDCADQQDQTSDRLNAKTRPAHCGGLGIAHQIKDTAADPDKTKERGADIAHVIGEQPQQRQKNQQPFERVHLHAEDALEIGIAGNGRHRHAIFLARPRHAKNGEKIKQNGEYGDE